LFLNGNIDAQKAFAIRPGSSELLGEQGSGQEKDADSDYAARQS